MSERCARLARGTPCMSERKELGEGGVGVGVELGT